MLYKLFSKIDGVLCAYLGLKAQEVTPNSLEIKDGQLFIHNTSSFKRHVNTESWEEFVEHSFEHTTSENKEKLGLALGKSLANNLVISFEPTSFSNQE